MRKVILAALAVAASLAVVLPARAETVSPQCADIIDGSSMMYRTNQVPVYQDPPIYPDTRAPHVEGQLVLSAASCANVTYTVYVFDADGFGLTHASRSGNGSTSLSFDIAVPGCVFLIYGPGCPEEVRFYAETSGTDVQGDRAPDNGTLPLTLNGPGPGMTWH